MARYSGSGRHKQSIRHSNAKRYGKAGGVYANVFKDERGYFVNVKKPDGSSTDSVESYKTFEEAEKAKKIVLNWWSEHNKKISAFKSKIALSSEYIQQGQRLSDLSLEEVRSILDHPQTYGIIPETKEGRKEYEKVEAREKQLLKKSKKHYGKRISYQTLTPSQAQKLIDESKGMTKAIWE